MRDCEVLVVGGGSAGLTAAVGAARAGAEVLLVERGGFLGGVGTASLVHTFCGLYHLAADGRPAEPANPGLAGEVAERMQRATGIGPQLMGRVWVLPQHPVEFVRIADQLVAAERSLQLRFHAEVIAAGRDGDGWAVDFICRGKRQRVTARALVDASGDAVLAPMLGATAADESATPLQRPAYITGIAGVAGRVDADDRLRLARRIVEAVRSGRLEDAALGTSFRGSGRPGEVFVTIDLAAGGDAYDPTGSPSLTGVELAGRGTAAAVVDLLRDTEPDWSDARICHWPVRAGVRESRRWQGRLQLSAADWLAGAQFDDQVALATWPMEFRRDNRGPKLRYPEADRPCGIPLRCLQPDGFDGVWCAGRCISVDNDVQASVRVMGTCFATGEAAGRAAAQAV